MLGGGGGGAAGRRPCRCRPRRRLTRSCWRCSHRRLPEECSTATTPPSHQAPRSRRRGFCHFADTPSFTPIETPTEGRGGVQQSHGPLADGAGPAGFRPAAGPRAGAAASSWGFAQGHSPLLPWSPLSVRPSTVGSAPSFSAREIRGGPHALSLRPERYTAFPCASVAIVPKTDAFACGAGSGTLPFLALLLRFSQRRLHLLAVLQPPSVSKTPPVVSKPPPVFCAAAEIRGNGPAALAGDCPAAGHSRRRQPGRGQPSGAPRAVGPRQVRLA